MPKYKNLMLVVAVAVMLAGATSAYAYSEKWEGFFGSGTITYNDTTYTYTYATEEAPSYIYAWTYDANVDSITGSNLNNYRGFFYYVEDGDTLDSLVVKLVDYGSYKKVLGTKATGTSGTKEGDGTWTGHCTNKSFYLRGTWDTTGDNEDFDYTVTPPTGNGGWDVTWSSAQGVSGSGLWAMKRSWYSE